ncbi:hypothetical protein NEUTE2DRAFT_119007, partial [Neurospora tetrasperma FGSC 2509]
SPPKRRKLTTETEGRLNAHIIATHKLKEKRTLVSLPEANDVAKRLGEMKVGSKYNYQLAPPEEEGQEEEEVKRFADDETPFASKPDRGESKVERSRRRGRVIVYLPMWLGRI